MSRWFKSLQAQLFLWAILPVTFVIIALAFTGVYTHQQTMRDFVAERDLALARLTARMVEDGLAHGVVGIDGTGLATWMSQMVGDQVGTVLVVDGEGTILAHPDSQRVGASLQTDPGVMAALAQQEGAIVVTSDDDEPMMTAFVPVAGTDWVVLVREPVEDLIGPILQFGPYRRRGCGYPFSADPHLRLAHHRPPAASAGSGCRASLVGELLYHQASLGWCTGSEGSTSGTGRDGGAHPGL
jgi:hypothetical protein